ncbi:MAG: hypothetical protein Q9178_000465 [Gyalolechia marmorata]
MNGNTHFVSGYSFYEESRSVYGCTHLHGQPEHNKRDCNGYAIEKSELTDENLNTGLGQSLEPIAIVGMAMRLAEEYAVPRIYGICWYADEVVDARYGYFLDDLGLRAVDPSFWAMSKQEDEALDPQQSYYLKLYMKHSEVPEQSIFEGKRSIAT